MTQDKVKNFYNVDNQCVKANFYDNSDSMGMPRENKPRLSRIEIFAYNLLMGIFISKVV